LSSKSTTFRGCIMSEYHNSRSSGSSFPVFNRFSRRSSSQACQQPLQNQLRISAA
jgi:hypothetical protein